VSEVYFTLKFYVKFWAFSFTTLVFVFLFSFLWWGTQGLLCKCSTTELYLQSFHQVTGEETVLGFEFRASCLVNLFLCLQYWDWTQSFICSTTWATPPVFFCFIGFKFHQTQTEILLVPGITDAHHTLIVGWDWGLANILPRLVSNFHLPDSAFQAAEITDMSRSAQPFHSSTIFNGYKMENGVSTSAIVSRKISQDFK
jgi:hypothetical protein